VIFFQKCIIQVGMTTKRKEQEKEEEKEEEKKYRKQWKEK
jgi:hypothetical protein